MSKSLCEFWVKAKHIRRIIAIAIFIGVTIVLMVREIRWLSLIYSVGISLLATEIKSLIMWVISAVSRNDGNRIRVVCSYMFRIRPSNNGEYFLVKEHEKYRPVGGVYKYYPDKVDVSDAFYGDYDGKYEIIGANSGYENDLRIKISKRKKKIFWEWFSTQLGRENITNLSREFKEELIDSGILPKEAFKRIKYRYLGSYSSQSNDQHLKMRKESKTDIVELELTTEQCRKLLDLLRINDKYIFANENDIRKGKRCSDGIDYIIDDSSKLILVENAGLLVDDFHLKNNQFEARMMK